MLDVDFSNMLRNVLRLCTYNVLANKFAIREPRIPETTKWKNRGPRLVKNLERISADLLFMQEVEEPVFKAWHSHFGTLGYDGASYFQAWIGRVVAATETVERTVT